MFIICYQILSNIKVICYVQLFIERHLYTVSNSEIIHVFFLIFTGNIETFSMNVVSSRNRIEKIYLNDDLKAEKTHKCSFCTYSTFNSTHLRMHLAVHTGEKPFGCHECGKTFRLKHHLEYHLNTHPGEKPFRCEKCGKSFIKMTFLKNHEIRHH